jgi:ATP-dependent Lon protease
VIIPKDNEKDLADIPPEVRSELTICVVEAMDEVLRAALERPIEPTAAGPVPEVASEYGAEPEADQNLTN